MRKLEFKLAIKALIVTIIAHLPFIGFESSALLKQAIYSWLIYLIQHKILIRSGPLLILGILQDAIGNQSFITSPLKYMIAMQLVRTTTFKLWSERFWLLNFIIFLLINLSAAAAEAALSQVVVQTIPTRYFHRVLSVSTCLYPIFWLLSRYR